MNTIPFDPHDADPKAILEAAKLLDRGDVIAFPTETLYGLLARLDRPEAVAAIYRLKGRADAKPLPCVAADAQTARTVFDPVPNAFDVLTERFWPGPLTLVGRARRGLIAATGGSGTIGVRVPASPALRRLAELSGILTATSANRSGHVPAASAEHVRADFAGENLTLFDGGALAASRGSTVLDLVCDPPGLWRQGDVTREGIEAVLGAPVVPLDVRDGERLQELRPGSLRIIQKLSGFRYSVDALLLAGFAEGSGGECLAEIGAGTGVVSLILAARTGARLTAVEIQEDLADMARRSVIANGLADRVEVVGADARDFAKGSAAGRYDAVVSNPPHYAATAGDMSPDTSKATSRHEISLSLVELAQAAGGLLKDGGRFHLLHRAQREQEILRELGRAGFGLDQGLRVHPRPGEGPKFLLVTAVARGKGREVFLPALVLHEPDGSYTAEAQRLIDGAR